jgi:hypothetical protein
MNPLKKIYVNFRNPRSIYDPANKIYKRKYKPSNQKEENRMKRRLLKINPYEDEETREPPIESLTANKTKLIFKMLGEFANSHRLSRKEIPQEEKAEYIKKSKEFSLKKSHEWRKIFSEYRKSMAIEDELLRSSLMLPSFLAEEILDFENQDEINEEEELSKKAKLLKLTEDPNEIPELSNWEEKDLKKDIEKDYKINSKTLRGFEPTYEKETIFEENAENAEELEFLPEFLYLPQLLHLYPDDLHVVYKTLINLTAYEEAKQGGIDEQGDSLTGNLDED